MTQTQLEKDIESRLVQLNNDKCIKLDNCIPQRRSFNDLFAFYRPKGVTEKMLMTALKNLNFVARYCSKPRRVVFFKNKIPDDLFWWTQVFKEEAFKAEDLPHDMGKYTPTYLEELYKSIA